MAQNIFALQPVQPAPPQGPPNIYQQGLQQQGLPQAPQPYQPTESAQVLGQVAQAYPGLAKHLGNAVVRWGKNTGPEDDRQLEYYPPWEGDNPNPGKNTVELYNKNLKGQDLTDSVALDMLHYAGSVDPRTAKPVDPQYYALKKAMVDQLRTRNASWDVADYKDSAKYGDPGTYDDYLEKNRADAYIRALVSPRMNPEWSNPALFTPEMKSIGAQIRAYISTHPQAGR